MKWSTRKTGIWIMIIGIVMFFPLNILTLTLFNMDIDIFGFLIFIVGVVLTAVNWKKH